MDDRLRIKVVLSAEARQDIDRLSRKAQKQTHGRDEALFEATIVMLHRLNGRRHPTKPLDYDSRFADLSDCDTTYVGADPYEKPPLRIVSRDIPPRQHGGITQRKIIAIGPRQDSQVYRVAGQRLDRKPGITLDEMKSQRQAASRKTPSADKKADRRSAASLQHEPEKYRRDRVRFDNDLDHLEEIVASWNPDNPEMRPRIQIWQKNIATFGHQAADLDKIVEVMPEIAQSALTELSSKMDLALNRLDPQRRATRLPTTGQYIPPPEKQEQAEDEYQPGS